MTMTSHARRIHCLRQELAELRDPGSHDGPGHALFLALKQGLEDDLAEMGGGAAPESPRPTIRLSTPIRPKPAEAVLVAEPSTEVLPAEPVEKPMPKAYDTPKTKLAALQERLQRATARGAKTDGVRHEIRRLCHLEGLPVPAEAEKRPAGGAGKARSARKALAKQAKQLAPALAEAYPTPCAAARLRALRSQALEILPELEDLDPQQVSRAKEEMDMLAKVLVLGGELMARRSA